MAGLRYYYMFGVPIMLLALDGCAQSPALPVLGAIFPDWLFAITGGVLSTVLLHLILAKTCGFGRLQPLAFTYPAFTALSAMLVWLAVFHH